MNPRVFLVVVAVIVVIIATATIAILPGNITGGAAFAFNICHYNPAPGSHNGCQSSSLTDNMTSTILVWGSVGAGRANQTVVLVVGTWNFSYPSQPLGRTMLDQFGNAQFLFQPTGTYYPGGSLKPQTFAAGSTYQLSVTDLNTKEVSTVTLTIAMTVCPSGMVGTPPNCKAPYNPPATPVSPFTILALGVIAVLAAELSQRIIARRLSSALTDEQG